MPYIPNTDAGVLSWGSNFTTLITADPGRYGLEATNAALLQGLYDDFDAALTVALDPDTRTKPSVALKDGHKADFLASARAYAAIIRANLGVTDEDKVSLGLNVPDPTPTPIPPPSTTPVCTVTLAGIDVHQMSVADILTPTKKAKPQGVTGMLLLRTVTATPTADITIANLVQIVTKSDSLISTAGLEKGKYANYAGVWFNRKGELGEIGGVSSFIVV